MKIHTTHELPLVALDWLAAWEIFADPHPCNLRIVHQIACLNLVSKLFPDDVSLQRVIDVIFPHNECTCAFALAHMLQCSDVFPLPPIFVIPDVTNERKTLLREELPFSI